MGIRHDGDPLHPATAALLPFFDYEHLPDELAVHSEPCARVAREMAQNLQGPEVTAGLRKLLEAKDCFVRAALTPRHQGDRPTG